MGSNNKDVSGEKNPRYNGGWTQNKEFSSLYVSWQNMKARCLNPKHPKYHRYGGRGITICDSWLNINGFASWALANGWSHGLTIDRLDNDKGYFPENCVWISKSANSRKKSTTKLSIQDAQEIRRRAFIGEDLYEIAEDYRVSHGNVWFIVKNFTHVDEGECTIALKNRKIDR